LLEKLANALILVIYGRSLCIYDFLHELIMHIE